MNPHEIYCGSNGDATKALYRELSAVGPAGAIATNLFRACKCSERAKKYRGGIRCKGSYRAMAYDRKQWSIGNLCQALQSHAEALGIVWGWKVDPEQGRHRWVLYVDLPTGQASFHGETRGAGPDYGGEWDGKRASADHIIAWVEQLLGVSAG